MHDYLENLTDNEIKILFEIMLEMTIEETQAGLDAKRRE